MSGIQFNALVLDEAKNAVDRLTLPGTNGEAPYFSDAYELVDQLNKIQAGSGSIGQTAAGREAKNDLLELIHRREASTSSLE